MDVLMPQLGETVAEGKITRWFKAAGETMYLIAPEEWADVLAERLPDEL